MPSTRQFLRTAALAVLCLAFSLTALVAEGPRLNEKQARLAARVLTELEKRHLEARPLDDALSRTIFERCIDAFDPERLYLLDADIEEFARDRDLLDDALRAGEHGFALRVQERLLERVEQRTPALLASLDEPMDPGSEEYSLLDRSKAPYSSAEAADSVARKHARLLVLTEMAAGRSEEEARGKVRSRVLSFARQAREVDVDSLMATWLAAIASSYDPHSGYLSPRALKELRIAISLGLVGIGAYLEIDADGLTRVTKLVPGGAAERGGKLKAGDRILAIGEGQSEGKGSQKLVDVRGEPLGAVVDRIRGPVDSIVRLRVERGEGDRVEELELSISRAPVALEASRARGVLREVDSGDGAALRVGLLTIPAFYGAPEGEEPARTVRRDVAQTLDAFRGDGVEAVLLDLRNNSGGLMDEALAVAGLFVDAGALVQVRDREGLRILEDPHPGVAWKGPLVVLTNGRTASAAEIVAAALQDYRRGLIVGTGPTYGKGTVQELVALGGEDGDSSEVEGQARGALKLTVSSFHRPLGGSLQSRGVQPDIVLAALSVHRSGQGARDVKPCRIARADDVDAALVSRLTLASEKRRSSEPKLIEWGDAVASRARLRGHKWVRLRLDDVRMRCSDGIGSGDGRDVVLEEALSITRDHARARKFE